MDSQELNRACELAFLVAREGVEQDPPIDPPASMRMFLYVRQFPQRALTVARQVLTEDAEFRTRVAAVATIDNVGEEGLAWLQGDGTLYDDADGGHDLETSETPAADIAIENDQPVTKETIRSEMDELKNLVGQLSQERAAVDSEVEELAIRLEESEEASGFSSALSDAVSSDSATKGSASLTAQIRSLHTDLKQARADRDRAQEAKELAILEHAELAEELEHLRALASSAQVQLAALESKVRDVSTEKDQLASEKDRLSAEREALADDKDALSAEVTAAESRLAESEERLAGAQADLDTLTAELEDVRSNAGASVHDLQAAVAARAALESHVDALGGAHAKARAEMERVNAALDDKNTSDVQKIETLKVALAAVTAERDALQGKLDDVRATVSTLQGEMAKLESNFSGAESVATVLSERMEELQSSVDAFPAESSIEVNLSAFDNPEMPVLEADPAALIGTHPGEESTEITGDEPLDTIADLSDRTVEPDTEPEDSVVEDSVAEDAVVEDSVVDGAAAPAEEDDDESQSVSGDDQANELIPDEMFAPDSADGADNRDPEVMQAEPETSPLVMSDAADDFTAGLLHETPAHENEAPGQAPATEDIDEVHALVAETVASFEPSDTDNLPGSGVSASDAANAGVSTDRGGLTSLFSSFIPGGRESDVSESEVEAGEDPDDGPGLGLFAVAAAASSGAVAARVAGNADTQASGASSGSAPGLADPVAETVVDDDQAISGSGATISRRGPIVVPEETASDPLKSARFVVNTEDAVLLIDGDPVAAMGWPSVDRVEQRRNLVHYLSVMAGTSGASPDVLFDRDFGVDRLPDSRSVRVRVTNEGGSVSAQIVSLIDTYPNEWPVVVVTDNMDLAAEAAMKGATLIDNGQLLDLFIAP